MSKKRSKRKEREQADGPCNARSEEGGDKLELVQCKQGSCLQLIDLLDGQKERKMGMTLVVWWRKGE
jgi:hypothetical protein